VTSSRWFAAEIGQGEQFRRRLERQAVRRGEVSFEDIVKAGYRQEGENAAAIIVDDDNSNGAGRLFDQ